MYYQDIDHNQIKQNFIRIPNFTQTNSLIRKNQSTSHKISDITSKLQNLQLKIIVIQKQQTFMTKKGLITQCLVGDASGTIFMNLYNQTGKQVKQGDVLYANGIYSSKYKQMILLYQGDYSLIKRVGKKNIKFDLIRNLSQQSLQQYGQSKQQKQLRFVD